MFKKKKLFKKYIENYYILLLFRFHSLSSFSFIEHKICIFKKYDIINILYSKIILNKKNLFNFFKKKKNGLF